MRAFPQRRRPTDISARTFYLVKLVEDDDYVAPVVTKWLRGSFLPVTTELTGLQGVGTLSYEVETSYDGYRK